MKTTHTKFNEITIALHPGHAKKLADTLHALLCNGLNDSEDCRPNEHLICNLRDQLIETLGVETIEPKPSITEILARREYEKSQGNWVAASSGTEKPFTTRTGHKVQYMWQPSTGRHAYINLETDIIIADADLGNFGLG